MVEINCFVGAGRLVEMLKLVSLADVKYNEADITVCSAITKSTKFVNITTDFDKNYTYNTQRALFSILTKKIFF